MNVGSGSGPVSLGPPTEQPELGPGRAGHSQGLGPASLARTWLPVTIIRRASVPRGRASSGLSCTTCHYVHNDPR